MKTELKSIKVESYGVEKETFFGIREENTSHIFHILRHQLYSNKPLAILREYSTNAWDAHVEAGIPDKPIEITLPTTLSPTLKIRDFGLGLSEKDILEVFSSYGLSTKTNSNTQVGMLGLGSKSAFCYANSYDICSYFNNKKMLFTAYLDETNRGKIIKTLEQPTNEPNGIEISVSIKQEDIHTFISTARSFFVHFNPRPIFKGVSVEINTAIDRFKEEEKKVFLRGKNWILLDNKSTIFSTVVMGNVGYTLNTGIFPDNALLLRGTKILFHANIGDVMVTASRETLEYNSKTKAWISLAIEDLIKEGKKQAQEHISDSKTLWEARIKYNSFVTQNYNLKSIFNTQIIYDNKQVTDTINNNIITEFNKEGIYLNNYSADHKKRLCSYGVYSIKPEDNIIFVLMDESNIPKKRDINRKIHSAINAVKKYNRPIFVSATDESKLTQVINHPDIVGAPLAKLSDYVIDPTITTTTPINKDRNKCSIFSFIELDNYYRGPKSSYWEITNLDLDTDSGIYVKINRFNLVKESWLKNDSLYGLKNIVTQARKLKIDIPKVYGIRDNTLDKKGKNWISLTSYLAAQIKDIIVKNNLQNHWNKTSELAEIPTQYVYLSKYLSEFKDGKFKTILTDIINLSKATTEIELATFIKNMLKETNLNIELNTVTNTSSLKLRIQELENTYPLLKEVVNRLLNTYSMSTKQLQDFSTYIECIEHRRKIIENHAQQSTIVTSTTTSR